MSTQVENTEKDGDEKGSDSDECFHSKLMKKMYPAASKASIKADEPPIEWTASCIIPHVHKKPEKPTEGREVVPRSSLKQPVTSDTNLNENPNLELAADEAMVHIMKNTNKTESDKDSSGLHKAQSLVDEVANRNLRLMNSVSFLQRAGNDSPLPPESKSNKILPTNQEPNQEKRNVSSNQATLGCITKVTTGEAKIEKTEPPLQTKQKNDQDSLVTDKTKEPKLSLAKVSDFPDIAETPPDYKAESVNSSSVSGENTPSTLLSPREFLTAGQTDNPKEQPSKYDFHTFPFKQAGEETSQDDFTEILIPASKAKVSEESTLNKRVKDEAMSRKSMKEGGSAKRVSWKEEQPTVVPYLPERSPRRRITRNRSSSKEQNSWSTISGPRTTNSSWSHASQGSPQPSFLRTKIDEDDSDDEFDNFSRCCCFRIAK